MLMVQPCQGGGRAASRACAQCWQYAAPLGGDQQQRGVSVVVFTHPTPTTTHSLIPLTLVHAINSQDDNGIERIVGKTGDENR